MNLYILRHAIAAERGATWYPNDDRPLTKEGIEKMKKEAECFPALIGGLDIIYTSPLSRARETAVIAAESLHASEKIKVTDALLPGACEEEILEALSAGKKDSNIMIVGHEPHLSAVVSLLLGGTNSTVALKKGGLCLIEISGRTKKGAGTMQWLLQPRQLRGMRYE